MFDCRLIKSFLKLAGDITGINRLLYIRSQKKNPTLKVMEADGGISVMLGNEGMTMNKSDAKKFGQAIIRAANDLK